MALPADAVWTEFSGIVPVLRFASLPLFPYAVSPFQFTQPGQRIAIEEALKDQGVVLLLATESDGLRTEPPGLGSLAKINVCCPMGDHSLRVTLRGLVRAEVVEMHSSGLFQVRAVADRYPSPPAIDRIHRRQELLAEARACCRDQFPLPLETLVTQEVSLGCLCDVLAQGLSLSAEAKQELLTISNVDYRSDLLLDHLRAEQRRKLEYPPRFSSN